MSRIGMPSVGIENFSEKLKAKNICSILYLENGEHYRCICIDFSIKSGTAITSTETIVQNWNTVPWEKPCVKLCPTCQNGYNGSEESTHVMSVNGGFILNEFSKR